MSDVPSIPKRTQVEEVSFESPISESTFFKMGGVINFLLDNYAIPPGASMDFHGIESNVPIGWIPCDGRAVSRTTYANLFAAIGTQWGIGNGVTTFNVPERRGMFSRMVDATSVGQAGTDPDHASRTPIGTGTAEEPGSSQGDQYRSHNHRVPRTGGGAGQCMQVAFDADANVANWTPSEFTGGNETRSKNVYVLVIIKT